MKHAPFATWISAVAAVQDGMSVRRAAIMYEVSREPLRKRVHGLVPLEAKPGPQLVYLSEGGDRGVVKIVHYRALHGMCVGLEELRCMIREAAEATGTHPLIDDFSNDKWISRWVANHHTISVHQAQLLDVKRALASTPDAVINYYNNLNTVLNKFDLVNKPEPLWNCDETGVFPQGRGRERVICPKGLRANVQRFDDRENVSIMACVSASGERMPPIYIFIGKYKKSHWMEEAEKTARCAISESSNIKGKLFLHWFKWFVSCLPPGRPQLLLLDGHFAHIQIDAVKYGTDRGVHLFILPAHTSHFLQPLDVSVFGPFKRYYEKELKGFPSNDNRRLPIKDNVAGITCKPLQIACSEDNAKNGFKKAGIFPLSLDAMLKGIIGSKPAIPSETLPHVAIIMGQKVPPSRLLEVSDQQKRVLQELDLNADALNVVNLLSCFTMQPRPQKRKRGKWVDDRYTDGDLLNYKMLLAEEAKAADIAEELRQKAARAAAREPAKLKKDREKAEKAKAREDRAKEKAKLKAEQAKKKAVRAAVKAECSSKKRSMSTVVSVEQFIQISLPDDICMSMIV